MQILGNFRDAHNKKIKSLTAFAGTHLRGAALPLCPTQLRRLA